MAPLTILSDLADLVLGRQCLGCDTPAPGVCAACLDGLRGGVTRVPGAGPATFAASEYSGLARELVVAYKKQGYRSLAAPLGWLLADAVWAAMQAGGRRECVIVPVPGHRRSRRGFDALGDIVGESLRAMSRAGVDIDEERLLRPRADYPTLKGLGRAARWDEVAGAFLATAPARARPCAIVVDDVLTTGATIAEAVATLQRARVPVAAVAVIAATASPGRWATIRGPAPATRRS